MDRDAGEDKGVETTAAQRFRSTELFSTYMEPLCGVSRGKTGETDTGNALRVLVKDVVRRGVPGIVNANKQEQQHRSANEEQG